MTNLLKLMIFLLMLVSVSIATGCGQKMAVTDVDNTPALTARTLGEQSVVSNAEHLAAGVYAKADAAQGERIAMQCRACHSFAAGGVDMIGPALHGFFGKMSGSRGEFAYSSALGDAAFIWTPRSVDAWLMQPARFLPGNRMIFAGVNDAEDRRALVAFLLKVTDDAGGD